MNAKFANRLTAAAMTPTVRARKWPLNTPIPASSMTRPTIMWIQPHWEMSMYSEARFVHTTHSSLTAAMSP